MKIVALNTISRAVNDLERTVAFYQRVFGFQVLSPVGRPMISGAMDKLTNVTGARYRQGTVQLPSTGLVLRFSEASGIERTPRVPRLIDPGQTHLRFAVTDVDLVVANLQRAGAQFVSPTGAAVAAPRSGVTSAFLARDPDGYLLEVVRGEGSQASNVGAAASPVLDVRLIMTTEDTDKKLAFYKDLLGMDVTAGTWAKVGTGADEVRSTVTKETGGHGRMLEFQEFRNAGEKVSYRPRVHDPGAGMVSVVVRDLGAMVKAVQAANLPIVTADAQPLVIGVFGSLRRVIVQDPDGVFVELVES